MFDPNATRGSGGIYAQTMCANLFVCLFAFVVMASKLAAAQKAIQDGLGMDSAPPPPIPVTIDGGAGLRRFMLKRYRTGVYAAKDSRGLRHIRRPPFEEQTPIPIVFYVFGKKALES